GSPRDDIGNQRFIGQPLYVIYDYKKIGIWQTSEADQATKYGTKPGQIKIEDVNNDGKIDANDRQVIGSRQPKFEAGITNRFRIDLGYTLPAAWAKTAFMSSARIYIQVQNPYIWAKDTYFERNKAIDPDALSYSSRFDSGAGVNAANISFQGGSNYPVTRSFILGVNL
nr:hypothetical protein [Tanacetum cinerariifolium]